MRTNQTSQIKLMFFLLCLWVLSGCGQSKPAVNLPASPQSGGDFTEFKTHLETVRQALKIPGMSVAVVQDQELLWAAGFGYADLENQVATAPDTPYGLASVTKPVAAVLVMQLVEEGRVDLDDPITDYGVNLLGNQITIRHLAWV